MTTPAGARPHGLTRADLSRIPSEHQVEDVGALAAGREGRAVRLGGVLDLVGSPPGARYVHVESSDGSFTANIPLADARAGGLVLYELGDEALPRSHGGPFRLLFPDGDDCSVNVKFLGRVDLLVDPGSHTARCADEPAEGTGEE